MGKPRKSTFGLLVSKTAISRGTKKIRRTVSEFGRFIETWPRRGRPIGFDHRSPDYRLLTRTRQRLRPDTDYQNHYCNVNRQNELRQGSLASGFEGVVLQTCANV